MRELFHSRRQRSASSLPRQHDTSSSTHQPVTEPLHFSSAPNLPPVSHQYTLHSQLPPHPRQEAGSRRRRVSHLPPSGVSRTSRVRSTSSHQSNARSVSQQSTATMTDYRSVTSGTVTVPSYVHGAASRISDDEASWISGVESHPPSVGGASNTSSKGTGVSGVRNPYLRDGKKTKRIIDDLIRADDEEATLTTLSIVCVEFDHNDTIKHNAELYYGVVGVLAQKLSMTDNHDAIRMICSALEMVFRAGTKYVKEAFHVNAPAMIPPLLRLLARCEQSKVKFPDENILNITKVFHYWSRIPELRISLARQQGLLDSLRRVATSPLNVPSRHFRVRVLANLANCDDNKVLIYAHKGLLTSLLKIAHLDPVDATREYATIALMDLASAPANQVPLANNSNVLRVLTNMVVSEKVTSIRESATTTLQNLAFPKRNRLRIVEFQGGVVMEALLKVLQRDPNEKSRRRAGGALTNLAYELTAEMMATHPGLLATLAQVAIQEDTNEEIQSRACLALTKIASVIKSRSPTYPALLDALVVAADTRVDNNIPAVFRLRAREPEGREMMARHPGVLEKLAGTCFKPSLKDRNNATRTIMHLANNKVNRALMCNDEILEALIHGVSASMVPTNVGHLATKHTVGTDQETLLAEMQDSALRAIARLATEHSNRQTMAKHKGLITAIARATEREAKLELKDATNSEQRQTFLGKPLLLSLLMAM